jgi:hypothetical protein
MYCRYCLQPIPERSNRCPECGSNLLETAVDGGPQRGRFALTPAQTQAAAIIFVFVAVAFLCTIVGLARPQMLPEPLIVALNLGTATPTPTLQVQQRDVVATTPTPMSWVEHTNGEAGFRISLPNGWRVINQARPAWQNDLIALNRDYDWANALFESRTIPVEARSRAVDPSLVNPETGQALLLTVSRATHLGEGLTLTQLEELLGADLGQLAELTGPVRGDDFVLQRSLRQTINGREALFIELTGRTTVINQPAQTRIQLYFIQIRREIYMIAIMAEEQVASGNRAIFEQIVNSFEPVN